MAADHGGGDGEHGAAYVPRHARDACARCVRRSAGCSHISFRPTEAKSYFAILCSPVHGQPSCPPIPPVHYAETQT